MPTIDISLKDFRLLTGKDYTEEELERQLLLVKGEIDGKEGDTIKVDCKESNRPDLWSTEGMARLIRAHDSGKPGLPIYEVTDAGHYLHVDRSVDEVRPFIAAAVIKNCKISSESLRQLIQLQEKVCLSFGRKRALVAIGIYDFDKIDGSMTYKTVPPATCFTPLDYTEEMSLSTILETHPKGKEYAHLLSGAKRYPVLVDKKGSILSMPPIINAAHAGKVTEKTKNLFIEVTGTAKKEVDTALLVMTAAIADRGGQIESVCCDYGEEKYFTPDFSPRRIKVKFTDIERTTGLKWSLKELKETLERYSYRVKKAKDAIEVEYLPYRMDIFHPIDVIEDILISYGYNNIEPQTPSLATTGSDAEEEQFAEKIRQLLPGTGAQEVMTFTLTNKDQQFQKMNREEEAIVEIANPVSLRWSALRNWLLPSLLEFLENNTSEPYPQQLYELGDVVIFDASTETGLRTVKQLAWVFAGTEASFTKAKQLLEYLLAALQHQFTIQPHKDNSFINGRCAIVKDKNATLAIIGELHPRVLEQHNLSCPVAALQLDISLLYEKRHRQV